MRAACLLVLLAACDQGVKPDVKEPPPPPPAPAPKPPPPPPTPRAPVAADLDEYTKDLGPGNKLVATFDTTHGTITCELLPDKAPRTVANFVGLARGLKPWLDPMSSKVQVQTPFYDGLTFHRVIPDFMIQGGDPLGRGYGGPGYAFDDEPWDGQHVGPGALAMANAGVRGGQGTNGSQFFIMEGNRPDLNGKHTVFGTCTDSLPVVKALARVPKDEADKPIEPVRIKKLTITRQ